MDTATKNRPDEACSLQDIVAKQAREIRRQQQRITVLEEYIRLQRHRQFGSRSEKAPGQGELFDEAELLAEEDALPAEEESVSERGRPNRIKNLVVVNPYPQNYRASA